MTIEQLQAKLRALGTLTRDAMPDVAARVERELRKTAAAGTSPTGKAWTPTKEGTRALPNAASKITVKAVGDVIVARIDGPYALHHKGRARGGVRRQILPTVATAAPILRAVRDVILERANG